jgi:hypothetical protein
MEINCKDWNSIDKNTRLNTVLCADDQVLTAKSEDDLKTAANRLNKIKNIYNVKISKRKAMEIYPINV